MKARSKCTMAFRASVVSQLLISKARILKVTTRAENFMVHCFWLNMWPGNCSGENAGAVVQLT